MVKILALALSSLLILHSARCDDQKLTQWLVKYQGDKQTLQRKLPACTVRFLFRDFYKIDALENESYQLVEELHNRLLSEFSWVERQKAEEKDLAFPAARSYQAPGVVWPNDERWEDQWYLNGSSVDMNVTGAWEQEVTGTGVTVAVVDSGINDHQELVAKIHREHIQGTTISSNSHGTWVAGVIAAARNNKICGSGISPGVRLVDVKIFGGVDVSSTPADEAAGLVTRLEQVDIYHNSWTAVSTGAIVTPAPAIVRDAVEEGIKQGRKGRGAIYVWSAGNGGDEDGCAYDGYLNSPHVIVVSGVDRGLRKLGTGESCSAVMVAAFSSDVTEEEKNPIITPSGDSECTDTFGRSSAASPMVTGAIALALEANPDLTYRDVMHILATTSRVGVFNNSADDDFVRNAAGLQVSPSFGFGLLDIGGVVSAANTWTTDVIRPRGMCQYTIVHPSNSGKKTLIPQTSRLLVSVYGCDVDKLEHVEVQFDGNFTTRGDLKMSLTSPGNTTAVILSGRTWDFFQDELILNSTAVTFWNENPAGTWEFSFEDLDQRFGNKGQIRRLGLRLYGQRAAPVTQAPSGWALFPIFGIPNARVGLGGGRGGTLIG